MLLAAAALIISSPAVAAGHYAAEPAAQPSEGRLIVRGTVWKLNGAVYEAAGGNSRPAIVCAALARQVGALKSFSVAGTPLGVAELQKCNARAHS